MMWVTALAVQVFALQGDDTRAREEALFGGSADQPVVVEPEPSPPQPIPETLAVGGRLYLRLDAFVVEGDAGEHRLAMPNLLDVYLDARPDDRVRGYARGRLLYDPVSNDPFTGEPVGTDAELDQLWIAFDLSRRVFVTAGAYPVRWGVGRIWNPTDFVNVLRRNPLSQVDLRTGVPLVRVAVPFEGGQVQALALLDGASRAEQVGGAARAEVAFSTLELGAQVATRRAAPLRLGADLSAGVGDLDLYVEAAVQHGEARAWSGELDLTTTTFPNAVDRDEDWIPQVVGGLEWSIPYGDSDAVVVGAEYFYNDAGYDDPSLYPWLAIQGDLVPFYVGRHYVGAFAFIAAPGSWNDTTFALTGLGNLSDRTGVVRFQATQRALAHLWVEPYVMGHLGEPGGELAFTLDLPAFAGQPAISVPRPYVDVGIWIRVEM